MLWGASFAPALLSQGIASRGVTPTARAKFSGKPWQSRFTDVSRQAGLTQPVIYGGISRVEYIVETSGGGLAAIDYDRDGWADLFVVNGSRFPDAPAGAQHRLYHNNHDGTFTDVSKSAGVDKTGWGMGVAIGDYDGDGYDDLYITQWGQDLLLRNNGNGTFSDLTAQAGLSRKETRWGSGATFIDYDRDGDLDLFVSNYLDYDLASTPRPGANPNCTWKGLEVACGPRGLKPGRQYLFRNDKGRFKDVSSQAGISKAQRTYGMTAVAADLDNDGWPDIYVASDSTPSLFFHNKHDGTFSEEGLERGIAVNEDGREQAGMGIATGDYNADGRLDIFKTHFAEDTHVLYRNQGEGQFEDVTVHAGLAVETRFVGWGASLADFDNDGWPDIFLVTGNVYPETDEKLPAFPYKTPPLLFRNLGNGKFEQIPAGLGGAPLDAAHSSRGSIAFDFNNDGALDIAIWNRNEAPTLLRNEANGGNHWIQFEAPIGTRITLLFPDGRKLVQEVLSQSSFYSAPGRVLHFGTGGHRKVDAMIRLPDGSTKTMRALETGQRHRIR